MAVRLSEMMPRLLAGIRAEMARVESMTPEQLAMRKAEGDRRHQEYLKHAAFLDKCVAQGVDPNLVGPIRRR